MSNPRSFNRYAYALNNPLKYIDPSGLDVIIVGGSGSTTEENTGKETMQEEWADFVAGLNLAPDEQVIYVPDIDPDNIFKLDFYNVEPRLQQLLDRLNQGDLTDIALIGFSEGAATVGTFLSNLADNPDLVSSDIASELHAAILLECPTGILQALAVKNYNSDTLNNLPKRLHDAGFSIRVADVWNTTSFVHSTGALRGWESRSFPYNVNTDAQIYSFVNPSFALKYFLLRAKYGGISHKSILSSEYAMYIARCTISGPTWNARP